MDSERFDRLTRAVGSRSSRRTAIGAVMAGLAMSVLGRGKVAAQVGVPGGMCGGFAGIPCPPGYTCIDDPGDGCDPFNGGADCSGICVPDDYNPCAAISCMTGTICCPNCGGICVPPGTECTDSICGGEPCNEAVCGFGEYCCNESCSRCVPLGDGCTREFCGPDLPPGGTRCGDATCGVGEFCCNPSCSICAPLGGSCIEMACEPVPPQGVPCGPAICAIGEVCCNESCGICTPPDGVCIAMFCVD